MTEKHDDGKNFIVEETILSIHEVKVKERLRDRLNEENVERLMQSFVNVGLQIHPITVDEHHVLVAGEHRLEAMRRLTTNGVLGWDTIRTLVVKGASESDRRVIELEENQARAAMSPVEIQRAWASYGEPLFESKAEERKVRNLRQGLEVPESPVISNTNNGESDAPVSLAAEARRATAKLEEARADQERFGLPILTGSEGQAKWGLTSRHALLRAAYAEQVEAGELSEDEFDQQILEPAKKIDYAGWWIDNREASVAELMELVNDPGERASNGGSENPY